MSRKEYLGDAVYADSDGYHVTLTTEDGICATNVIYLEPAVQAALASYLLAEKRLRADASAGLPATNGIGGEREPSGPGRSGLQTFPGEL